MCENPFFDSIKFLEYIEFFYSVKLVKASHSLILESPQTQSCLALSILNSHQHVDRLTEQDWL